MYLKSFRLRFLILKRLGLSLKEKQSLSDLKILPPFSSLITGQHGVDTTHGRADFGVGGSEAGGLVAQYPLHSVHVGQGIMAPVGTLDQGESVAHCCGGMAGCATSEGGREGGRAGGKEGRREREGGWEGGTEDWYEGGREREIVRKEWREGGRGRIEGMRE